MTADLILIADDDPAIRRLVQVNLTMEGFDTVEASNGEEAVEIARERNPALVLLDVSMPELTGIEVVQALRTDFRTCLTPIIMLTAQALSADKLLGFTAGADDYVSKPFDPIELIARVRAALRRSRAMRAVSPLTGLPGNLRIEDEINARVNAGEPIAVCYADLDNFKAFNDHYGFLRGDSAIVATGRVVRDAVLTAAPGAFVGHIGGDDFVVICRPDHAEPACKEIVTGFDAEVPSLYEPADAAAGGIEIENRQGVKMRYPMLSISIGVAIGGPDRPLSSRALVDVATELKAYAKHQRGSVWAVDRRGSGSRA